ncbi:dihydroneopterin aldolase [Microbacterium sp. TNHR37B]|uniref:dihydroneopterin aldolase n=1 Tax=Microbacterium sp. TNHR37B TaxID=1775956 RepID=UPI0007B1CE69|nr:dihydroneopterin aldolase [Microbacterium sp. TNHR37B]KZE89457.1 putative dihydroneopterin aldolase [Microbacterium sp. TNHR37B]
MTDRISITGIRAIGYHGVYGHERRDGQEFVADVVLELSLRRAAASDDVADTVHYGEVAERVAAVLSGEPANLVETVAQRIADAVLGFARVDAVTVTVHKPQAPIAVPFGDVAITIRRSREDQE